MRTDECLPGEYRLGLPAWAFPGWKGVFFRRSAAALTDYARVFNAVEGNTTFYRVPETRLVANWRAAVADRDFRFCFKLPRSVTHERRPDKRELDAFLRAIEPLGEHLGPLLVQFPARFGPDALARIEAVIERLPHDRQHALEVRHPRFFDEPALLDPLLQRYALGRIAMDTRALYRGDLQHPEVRAARHEKPDVPVLDGVYNRLRFARLVLHPDGRGNDAYVAEWADRVARDLAAGRRTYVFIHCPNNQHCPPFARGFHEALRRCASASLDALPAWPAENR